MQLQVKERLIVRTKKKKTLPLCISQLNRERLSHVEHQKQKALLVNQMSKEFSSDCKHSQTQAVLHFSPICLCERCKWPHASCLPRDKLCQHISTIFQSFSAFSALSISHSNSNHLISLPLPPSPSFFQAFKLYLSPLYQWFSSNSHYIFCDQTAQSSFLLTGNVSQTQEKC